MDIILFLIFLAVVIIFWIDSLAAREVAISFAKKYCGEINLQFLDESVAVKKLNTGRNTAGNFVFYRYYYFEFSTDGINRFSGNAFLIGQKPQSIRLNHPDGIIIHETRINK